MLRPPVFYDRHVAGAWANVEMGWMASLFLEGVGPGTRS